MKQSGEFCRAVRVVSLGDLPETRSGEIDMQSSAVAVAENTQAAAVDARAGKYLVFQLAKEEFGIRVLRVREIMGIQDITPVPRTPPHVKGVINLRGKVIPVIDLRL